MSVTVAVSGWSVVLTGKRVVATAKCGEGRATLCGEGLNTYHRGDSFPVPASVVREMLALYELASGSRTPR